MASKICQADVTLLSIVTHFEALWVKEYLSPQAHKQYLSGHISRAELEPFAEALKEMSGTYVKEEEVPKVEFSDVSAQAYLFYFFPINLIKILHILSQIPEICSKPHLQVLDFGAGPGTASAAVANLIETPITIDAIESDETMRHFLRRTLEVFRARRPNFAYKIYPALQDKQQAYDLIILANVLCELEETHAEKLINKLCSRLNSGGVCLLLEPALQHTTHSLQRMRNRILNQFSQCVPIFPCTRADACPMLLNSPDDWCHGTLGWEPPLIVQQLDELTGFSKHRLKYSAFVFQNEGVLRSGLRLLSAPESRKGRVRALACGKEVYGEKELPKTARRLRQFQIVELGSHRK